ncbi:hypothetical protein C9374_000918 [Naegleria lovaniensis]|uniref:Uncharacterized protein n=1 Tax=Naegleria lovaniensis TaxID=51637 RepID=A0AA88GX94_NAELO|nr:uncharacterized protein C9374_000918 [Naegleria lovaniensis]KAG2388068.1 hypothetical protein C9374_000918 [Naegleria lovaniensis]
MSGSIQPISTEFAPRKENGDEGEAQIPAVLENQQPTTTTTTSADSQLLQASSPIVIGGNATTTNTSSDVENEDFYELVTDLNRQIGVLKSKRSIFKYLLFSCFGLFVALSTVYFLVGLCVYFLVDFGNVTQGPLSCLLLDKDCYTRQGIVVCRARVIYSFREFLTIDEYPSNSPIWPSQLRSQMTCYKNQKTTQIALRPQIVYNPSGILISSCVLFAVAGISLGIVLSVFSALKASSKKKRKVKFYQQQASDWVKHTSNEAGAENQDETKPILTVTAHYSATTNQ